MRQAEEFARQQQLTASDVAALKTDPSPANRAAVAAKLGAQYGELAAGENAGLARAVLMLLVRDVEKEVRRALAETVAGCSELPREAALRLARDDIEVARPILRESPVLEDEDLLEIVRTSGIQYALAVAGRERISETVCDALVDTGHEEVVVSLAGNMGAELSRRTLQRIAEEFRDSRAVQDRLVKRPELPYEVVEQLVGMIGDRLQWELMRSRRISAEQARQLMNAVRERVSISMVAREHGDRRLLQYLRERHAAGELGGEELLAFLRDGDVAAFEAAFSILSGHDLPTVRRLLYDPDRRLLAALCIQAGLATPHYLGVRMALELAASCVESGAGEQVYSSDTVRYLQGQYERMRLDPEKVDELVARALGERSAHDRKCGRKEDGQRPTVVEGSVAQAVEIEPPGRLT